MSRKKLTPTLDKEPKKALETEVSKAAELTPILDKGLLERKKTQK